MDTTVNFILPNGSRKIQREALITKFLEEVPGSGNGNLTSRYTYIVDTYEDYYIYLRRPTQLNKGFDFVVNIHGIHFFKNRSYSNPSHNDIINILSQCKDSNINEYEKVKTTIDELYNCRGLSVLNTINLTFTDYLGQTHPIQPILLAIKWLFLEQDCAYWNYSGRTMLHNALKEQSLI